MQFSTGRSGRALLDIVEYRTQFSVSVKYGQLIQLCRSLVVMFQGKDIFRISRDDCKEEEDIAQDLFLDSDSDAHAS
jgi:hypothetical protein